jgi:hypothetical protein
MICTNEVVTHESKHLYIKYVVLILFILSLCNFNTVLRGISGKLDETPRVTEIKVRESFEKQLGISNERANVMLLTAVHCLPGGMDENKRNCSNVCPIQSNFLEMNKPNPQSLLK